LFIGNKKQIALVAVQPGAENVLVPPGPEEYETNTDKTIL